uniref:MICOS complex subunit n=1 Tax=Tetraodon nigroviridis TaxID=99883 RepID=H3DEB1_TETNG
MFLARKGSRFKRTVVPLGLMSAAAAVCYPAQAVAALKVTGKKVYSAGRWSSAAVSSLFVPKPQEAVAGHPTPPLPQSNSHSFKNHLKSPVTAFRAVHSEETNKSQNSSDGSGFKADPALMDFGQSSPEDEDLYSTRS